MLRIRPAYHHRTGTVESAADVRPGQQDRALLALSLSSKPPRKKTSPPT